MAPMEQAADINVEIETTPRLVGWIRSYRRANGGEWGQAMFLDSLSNGLRTFWSGSTSHSLSILSPSEPAGNAADINAKGVAAGGLS